MSGRIVDVRVMSKGVIMSNTKMSRTEFKKIHDNLYSEYLDDIVSTYYDIDPYNVEDEVDVRDSTGDVKSDAVETVIYHNRLDNSGRIDMNGVLRGFLTAMHNVDLDDEQQAVYDKACVLYASSFCKPGESLSNTAKICDFDHETRQMFIDVTRTLKGTAGSTFNFSMFPENMTIGDLKQLWDKDTSCAIVNKYPEVLDTKSFQEYTIAECDFAKILPHKNESVNNGKSKDIVQSDDIDTEFTAHEFE